MNKENLSPEAQKLIKNKIGYRCLEQVSGEYHSVKEILDYEINVLYNDSIPETMKKLYNYSMKNIDDLDSFIKKQPNVPYNYQLLWVTSNPLDAIYFYGNGHHQFKELSKAKHSDGTPIPVNSYLLSMPFMIIDDNGVDGQLIACSDTENIITRSIN